MTNLQFEEAPNGLRIVHMGVPQSAVGFFGIAVRVGSRDDGEDNHGLAHFVEHTIFKGTAKRRSWHIINRMEAVGGELNAFTTKEETVVFSAFPEGNLARAAELMADLVMESQFPEHEIEKEREVVADEIDSYLDTPADAVFDDFDELIFAGNELSHNILGTRGALSKFSSTTCREYLAKWYVPSNMVAFYAGSLPAQRVFGIIGRAFRNLAGEHPTSNRIEPAVLAPFRLTKAIESHQSHTVMGARIGSASSPDRYVSALLANILGGPGMNSLLNVALRERRGLVYSVDASRTTFSDCGTMTIYYGCDPHDNERCRRLVESTITSVADGIISERKLEAAKKQYLGQLVIAGENIENRILSIAHQYLFMGKVTSTEEIRDAIKSITRDEICHGANRLSLSRLTLGPRTN